MDWYSWNGSCCRYFVWSEYCIELCIADYRYRSAWRRRFRNLDVTFSIIPWQLVVIASTISIGVAMISGWRPARKATKIDVINALRQEL